jgi:hypothetical protein
MTQFATKPGYRGPGAATDVTPIDSENKHIFLYKICDSISVASDFTSWFKLVVGCLLIISFTDKHRDGILASAS